MIQPTQPHLPNSQPVSLALLGGLQSGKTLLLHKLLGQQYPSYISTTQISKHSHTIQEQNANIIYIDTPSVDNHIISALSQEHKIDAIVYVFKNCDSFTSIYNFLEQVSEHEQKEQIRAFWLNIKISLLVFLDFDKINVQKDQLFQILKEQITRINQKSIVKSYMVQDINHLQQLEQLIHQTRKEVIRIKHQQSLSTQQQNQKTIENQNQSTRNQIKQHSSIIQQNNIDSILQYRKTNRHDNYRKIQTSFFGQSKTDQARLSQIISNEAQENVEVDFAEKDEQPTNVEAVGQKQTQNHVNQQEEQRIIQAVQQQKPIAEQKHTEENIQPQKIIEVENKQVPKHQQIAEQEKPKEVIVEVVKAQTVQFAQNNSKPAEENIIIQKQPEVQKPKQQIIQKKSEVKQNKQQIIKQQVVHQQIIIQQKKAQPQVEIKETKPIQKVQIVKQQPKKVEKEEPIKRQQPKDKPISRFQKPSSEYEDPKRRANKEQSALQPEKCACLIM